MVAARYLLAGSLLVGACTAQAMDLMQAWQATRERDPQAAVAEAARQAGSSRKAQAAALWRPFVMLSATAGSMNADMAMSGAHFSAPGLGQSDGVGFGTSVERGNSTRWLISASQPLINQERSAQARQLEIGADVAQWEWQAAQQDLMLLTAQRYFDVLLASDKLALLREQHQAVELALTEARDRFALGDKPITDTHEASARAFALQAQVLATQDELALARQALADATGQSDAPVEPLPKALADAQPALAPLAQWLEAAQQGNPLLRMMAAKVQVAQQESSRFSVAAGPTLDLVAQAGRDQLSGSGNYGAASNTASQQMIGLQMNIPLFTGGMRSAKQDEALRLQDKAAAELERSRQQVSQQTRAAWQGMQTGSARLQALAEARKASQARLDATRLGRQVGDRTTLELLQAQNDASAAELALEQARVELLLNRLRLHALSGQLDEQQLGQVNSMLHR